MPCIVVLLAVLLGAGACAATTVRAEEAARLSARSCARGDPVQEAVQTGHEVIGAQASIQVGRSGGSAEVTVRTPAPGIIGSWGGLEITAHATARIEDSGAGGSP